MRQRGFTLLEVVITIAIFSLLALATYQLLDRVMRSDKRLSQHESQLRQLQRAMGILQRDLLQARHLPLLDDPSHSQALVSLPGGLTLLRGGWRNPLDAPRSNLLQVNHRWQDGLWLRESKALTHNTSSPPTATDTPLQQQLMQGVELKGLRFIDSTGAAHGFWPAGSERLTLPTAVEITLDAPGYPNIRRLILLSGDPEVEAEDE